VPTYKRLTLMMRDPDRLQAMLLHPRRPVQIVIAGKAHPADDNGKRLIQQMVKFADEVAVRHRIVFLPNYDIAMTQSLYPGCDVWLNNPLRPFEACGTSGMKAAMNGTLNLSVLDGWWDEAPYEETGFPIGPATDEFPDDQTAAALYDTIERQVLPLFFERNEENLPLGWIEKMIQSASRISRQFSSDRMMIEYLENCYLPASEKRVATLANGRLKAAELLPSPDLKE
jgi:starch phosphorylase